MNASITVFPVSVVFAFEARRQWDPGLVGDQPDGDLRFRAALVREPALAGPSPATVTFGSGDEDTYIGAAGPLGRGADVLRLPAKG
jgi:hypothetical protein